MTTVHLDPEFYAQYGFCRGRFGECDECERLDLIDIDNGLTEPEAMGNGLAMALEAALREREKEQP